LDNKVFDIIDARCNHEVHEKVFVLHWSVPYRTVPYRTVPKHSSPF